MPIDGGLVLEIVEQTHHPGCHSLIWKRSQGSHLRKPKKAAVSIQWARFINCRIHGHRLLTWAITKKYRHEMIMRRSRWKKLSKKSSREKMEIGCSGICRILLGLSLIISMTVWERRKTFNTVTEHKTTGNTKIWTNQARTVLFWCLLQPVQDRIPEKCWEEGLQNPEWSWYVQFQRAAQIELWTGQKAPLDVMRKELKEIIREENEKAQTEWFCNSVTSWEINVIVNL